ncbi:hypothetical protein [Streptomyces canus]|uniref:hypothetical protein n=1 Tax=Streptomyces canus TaxID=58343 RepID=UPI002DD990C5|nr:hypothetical protein [Streptomyces canus]WSD92504.1 hypothetical protein OG925_42175 [Streptomyces canus]
MTARDLTSHDANSSVLEAMSDADSPHEQVIYCNDPESGLRAIIAIHSLALGPAVGAVASCRTTTKRVRWPTSSGYRVG